MEKAVLIFGAFDRFNYGDLLFPLIIVNKLHEIDTKTEFNFNFYGIVNSDLSGSGGVPTRDIIEFKKDCNSLDKAVVIIAGGEVLNANWAILVSYLNQKFSKLLSLYKKIFKGRFISILDNVTRWYYKSPSEMPFIVLKKDFKNVDKVIYNAVGGPRNKDQIFRRHHLYTLLKESDYISVRDKIVYDHLNEIIPGIKLTPDSAILLSQLFPKAYLINQITPGKIDIQKEYLFFQINISTGRDNIKKIAEQLTAIHHKHGLEIILCPIGTALGHEDQVPLYDIYESLDFPSKLIEFPSIWDIMHLISNAALYIGTSLHGTITSMSYGKPYLGIGKMNSKLDAYLNSWGVNGINRSVTINNLATQAEIALSVSPNDLIEHTRKQIELSNRSFTEIHESIIQ